MALLLVLEPAAVAKETVLEEERREMLLELEWAPPALTLEQPPPKGCMPSSESSSMMLVCMFADAPWWWGCGLAVGERGIVDEEEESTAEEDAPETGEVVEPLMLKPFAGLPLPLDMTHEVEEDDSVVLRPPMAGEAARLEAKKDQIG